MIGRSLSISLVAGVFSAATCLAAPITYTINFTSNNGISPTGQFTYDSALASNPFTNFSVTAAGNVFTFTSLYNGSTQNAGAGCPNPGSPTATFLYLSGGCGVRTWSYVTSQSASNYVFDLDVQGNLPNSVFMGVATDLTSQSAYTIPISSATPEPSSVLFMLSGLAVLAGAGRWRHARRAQSI